MTTHNAERDITSPHAVTRERVDRRAFLAGTAGVAAVGLLAACGSSDGGGGNAAGDAASNDVDFTDGIQPGGGEFIIVQRIPDGILVPGEVRYPLQLSQNAEFINDGPDELGAVLADLDGNPLDGRLSTVRRTATPDNYYAFRMTIDEPGVYRLIVEGGPTDGVAFSVSDPATVGIATPGELLPSFDTPTPVAPGGVDPICTRDPMCEFHSITLTEALNTGKSVAYFIGTPALCQTGTCIPALEALVETMPEYTDTTVAVHAEVYADTTGTSLTPAMTATQLSFEPAIYITRPDGTISDRLDGLWNASELREALDRALV